jgi:hypothetical protein
MMMMEREREKNRGGRRKRREVAELREWTKDGEKWS